METAKEEKNRFNSYLDLIILISGLIISFFLWKSAQNFLLDQSKFKLISKIDLTQKSIENEILAYKNALYGIRGLFSSSVEVSTEEFDNYVQALDFNKQYSSAHTFTFISIEEDSETNEEIFLVKYAYPVKLTQGHNLKKSEERNVALEKARTTREIIFSKPLFIEGIEKNGFIATLPVFDNNDDKKVIGFINAIFLEEEFLKNVTKNSNEILETHIYIEGKLVYDSLPQDVEENRGFIILGSREVEIGGVTWKFDFLGDVENNLGPVEKGIPIAILVTGIFLSFLLFGITYSLSSSYKRAQYMANEITARLRETEERSKAIINSMGEGLFVLNNDHKIELINPIAEKLLGVTAEEAKGKDWANLVTTYKGDNVIPHNERSTVYSLADGRVVYTNLDDNHYYLTPVGKKFPIISTTTPMMRDGKVAGVIKVFRDATVDKQSKRHIEDEVVKRTAQLSASINSLALGFVMTNKDGIISLINNAAKDILNIESSIGRISDLSKLIVTEPSLNKLIITCHEKQELLEIKEVNFKNKVLHFYIAPVVATLDKVTNDIGTVILFDDITEEKIIDRSRDEFFSIASHELRTPLTAIRGNTSLIKDIYSKDFKDKELLEMVDDIHDSSVRLINIVNDFLNVSRLEMGRMEFKNEKVDVVKATKSVIEELQATANEKSIELKMVSPKSSKLIAKADPERLKQVLINLIGNGINYTEKKGKVIVSFGKEGKNIKIDVTDTGRGIPVENQKLLFHKFQQAGSSLFTRDTTKGTGLGLYISRLIVNGMGGTIALERSEIGKGSTFSFTLPISA